MRDEAREVLVLSSKQGFAEQDISPTGDLRQQVIFQGRALHFRLIDASQARDVACCYAVFAKGDDGNWHLQLTETVEPTSESCWKRTSFDADGESLQRAFAEMDIGEPRRGNWRSRQRAYTRVSARRSVRAFLGLVHGERCDELRRLGIDLGQHVGVDIQGEGHGGMPQPPRDDRRIDALGQGEAGVGVAQPVQGDLAAAPRRAPGGETGR